MISLSNNNSIDKYETGNFTNTNYGQFDSGSHRNYITDISAQLNTYKNKCEKMQFMNLKMIKQIDEKEELITDLR